MTSRGHAAVEAQHGVAGLHTRLFCGRTRRDSDNDGNTHGPYQATGSVGSLNRVPVEQVLLAEPRGFCAGVEMAIKALAWMVRAFEPPVYCYHEIVHNQLIVERFERQGVVFVDDITDVPPGYPIMLSAHGSAPAVVEAARAAGQLRRRLGVPARHQGPP